MRRGDFTFRLVGLVVIHLFHLHPVDFVIFLLLFLFLPASSRVFSPFSPRQLTKRSYIIFHHTLLFHILTTHHPPPPAMHPPSLLTTTLLLLLLPPPTTPLHPRLSHTGEMWGSGPSITISYFYPIAPTSAIASAFSTGRWPRDHAIAPRTIYECAPPPSRGFEPRAYTCWNAELGLDGGGGAGGDGPERIRDWAVGMVDRGFECDPHTGLAVEVFQWGGWQHNCWTAGDWAALEARRWVLRGWAERGYVLNCRIRRLWEEKNWALRRMEEQRLVIFFFFGVFLGGGRGRESVCVLIAALAGSGAARSWSRCWRSASGSSGRTALRSARTGGSWTRWSGCTLSAR